MTYEEFIRQLNKGLTALPKERRREIEDDILRHFEEGRANGQEEEQLIAMLGDPKELAAEYSAPYVLDPSRTVKHRGSGAVKKVLLSIGFFFLDLCIALPVAATLFACWVALACGFVIIIAGVVALLLVIANNFIVMPWLYIDYPLAAAFASIACVALGGIMAITCKDFGKLLIKLTRHYIRFHKKVLGGNEVAK